MKLTTLVAAAALMIGGISLIGCEPNNNPSGGQDNGYAGGNGAFGENPANPGEHSGQRFQNDTNNPAANVPTTQPAYGR